MSDFLKKYRTYFVTVILLIFFNKFKIRLSTNKKREISSLTKCVDMNMSIVYIFVVVFHILYFLSFKNKEKKRKESSQSKTTNI